MQSTNNGSQMDNYLPSPWSRLLLDPAELPTVAPSCARFEFAHCGSEYVPLKARMTHN